MDSRAAQNKTCTRCKVLKAHSEFYPLKESGKLHSWCKQCCRTKSRDARNVLVKNGPTKNRVEKTCPNCGTLKPISEYYRNRGTADGFANVCKLCESVSSNVRTRRRYRKIRGKEVALVTDGTRTCTKCGETKDISAFALKKTGKGGRRAYCMNCQNAVGRALYREKYTTEVTVAEKKCITCGLVKKSADFVQNLKSRDGLHNKCKICINKYNRKYFFKVGLKQRYGITPEEYSRLDELQDGKCAICMLPETENRNLAVDHCHVTNVVRGLLCRKCNTSLGHFNHDIEILKRAIEYLMTALAVVEKSGEAHSTA